MTPREALLSLILALALVAPPTTSYGQQPGKVYRIGWLGNATPAATDRTPQQCPIKGGPYWQEAVEGLRDCDAPSPLDVHWGHSPVPPGRGGFDGSIVGLLPTSNWGMRGSGSADLVHRPGGQHRGQIAQVACHAARAVADQPCGAGTRDRANRFS